MFVPMGTDSGDFVGSLQSSIGYWSGHWRFRQREPGGLPGVPPVRGQPYRQVPSFRRGHAFWSHSVQQQSPAGVHVRRQPILQPSRTQGQDHDLWEDRHRHADRPRFANGEQRSLLCRRRAARAKTQDSDRHHRWEDRPRSELALPFGVGATAGKCCTGGAKTGTITSSEMRMMLARPKAKVQR